MKKVLKKLIVISLLAGFVLSIGKSGVNNIRPMGEIDPGPANIHMN
ncbi:hypothetical protein [Streptococcus himalayensis]|uniref:Uncharacterized protein n=1 Tax=Streptococcus himalayensis TaxID=1888195 RepID=A0A917A2W2_9STRE|nr:hypothetical protein [Streptococcus himalayensis]GGE23656.1 hypothetical protein GCM10011510_00900 [Streptococcus himalayensis]